MACMVVLHDVREGAHRSANNRLMHERFDACAGIEMFN